MIRLSNLTTKQEALLPVVRDEWLKIGLASGVGDREVIRCGIKGAYRNAGLQEPTIWIELPSPLHGAIGAAFLTDANAQVRDQVWAQVGAQVGDQVGDQVYRAVYGQHDAGWLSYYAFYKHTALSDLVAKLTPLMDIARETGWWWPFKHVVIITPRPSKLSRDDRGQLHDASGPAIDYDGSWGVWAWHGVRVPQQVIESPETLTITKALNEQNTEIRRVMLTRIGSERLQAELPATVMDEDYDGRGQHRRLMRLGSIEDRLFVAYTCPSTGRLYPAQPVPPQVRTCAEAVAWRFRALDVDNSGKLTRRFDYAPSQEG